jgi:RHS repeat-associated protein
LANYRFGFNGQEGDNEVYGDKNSYNFEFRSYDARVGRWWGVDPLSDKYPSLTPYAYCANNPVRYVDPTGMAAEDNDFTLKLDIDKDPTRYRNTKGELLYETQDNLDVDIIVPDANVPNLESELQTAKDNRTINDAKTNQQKMHVLGNTPQEYSDKATKGMNDYWATGYRETYEEAYTKGKSQFSLGQIASAIIAGIATENNDSSGEMRHGGRSAGISEENSDRKNGRINRLNPPKSFKNNQPLIQLKSK